MGGRRPKRGSAAGTAVKSSQTSLLLVAGGDRSQGTGAGSASAASELRNSPELNRDDPMVHRFYRWRFEQECAKRENAFQEFVESLMERSSGGTFVSTGLQGNQGDMKCDGLQLDGGVVFQAYGPRHPRTAAVVKKIKEDFEGALQHWQGRMREWRFVHNLDGKLPPTAVALIAELGAQHPEVKITVWTKNHLWDEAWKLSDHRLQQLLDVYPFPGGKLPEPTVPEIRNMINHLTKLPPPPNPTVGQVSQRKLDHNQLSPVVQNFLNLGTIHAPLLAGYFARRADPTEKDQIRAAFCQKYMDLESSELTPDEIFDRLQQYVAGGHPGPSHFQAIVLTTLAHFFEECAIFRNPPEVVA